MWLTSVFCWLFGWPMSEHVCLRGCSRRQSDDRFYSGGQLLEQCSFSFLLTHYLLPFTWLRTNPMRAMKRWAISRTYCRTKYLVKRWATSEWDHDTRKQRGKTEAPPASKEEQKETLQCRKQMMIRGCKMMLAWSLISSHISQKPKYFRITCQPITSLGRV